MIEIFMALVISKCGLSFCPYCLGENGYNSQEWNGRMCQNGSRLLAEQGMGFRDILRFYYKDEFNFSDGIGNKQEPIQEGDCNKLIVDNDAEGYGVTVLSGPIDGDTYFKVVRVHHLFSEENGSWPGNHHLYLDVLDKDGNRINGAQLKVKWGESVIEKVTAIIDKPANEPGTNVPLYKYQVVSVEMKDYASDMAYNIHTDHPDEGGSNNRFHHSFLVVFQECIVGDITPEPEQPVDQIDKWRNRLWNEKGIDYFPDAAITKFARARGLGAPETNEVEDSGNIIQGFVNGWCHVIKGDWQNIHVEEW